MCETGFNYCGSRVHNAGVSLGERQCVVCPCVHVRFVVGSQHLITDGITSRIGPKVRQVSFNERAKRARPPALDLAMNATSDDVDDGGPS